jgi:hypothetical protein
MMRLVKLAFVCVLGVGAVYGMTRDEVINRMPEPIKGGLERLRMDVNKTQAGQGLEGRKEPGSGNSSGDETLPFLKSHGLN